MHTPMRTRACTQALYQAIHQRKVGQATRPSPDTTYPLRFQAVYTGEG